MATVGAEAEEQAGEAPEVKTLAAARARALVAAVQAWARSIPQSHLHRPHKLTAH